MKNSFGTNVSVTLFGESHGEAVGAVLDGMPAGLTVDESFIELQLTKRRGEESVSTKRRESDSYRILSGVFNGRTTGTPICVVIENNDIDSMPYEKASFCPRPGHADYTNYVKSHGFADFRGGGHSSGRLTAPLAAVGAICLCALEKKGIYVSTHLSECCGVKDENFDGTASDYERLKEAVFPVLDGECGENMKKRIIKTNELGESVGAVAETQVLGLPAGVGEPWFDSLESELSHAAFSIPAIKGIEFGCGFKCVGMTGSEMNDEFYAEDGAVKTYTNNNGGINGGISNGMPVVFRCAVKPSPSVKTSQKTVDLKTLEAKEISVGGRHDACIAPRACSVLDSVTALVLCDMLSQKFGTDWFVE